MSRQPRAAPTKAEDCRGLSAEVSATKSQSIASAQCKCCSRDITVASQRCIRASGRGLGRGDKPEPVAATPDRAVGLDHAPLLHHAQCQALSLLPHAGVTLAQFGGV